jgi:TPR repeat protein
VCGAESGWGGTKDLKRACEFYTKAAEQGNPVGQVRGQSLRGLTRVLAGQSELQW